MARSLPWHLALEVIERTQGLLLFQSTARTEHGSRLESRLPALRQHAERHPARRLQHLQPARQDLQGRHRCLLPRARSTQQPDEGQGRLGGQGVRPDRVPGAEATSFCDAGGHLRLLRVGLPGRRPGVLEAGYECGEEVRELVDVSEGRPPVHLGEAGDRLHGGPTGVSPDVSLEDAPLVRWYGRRCPEEPDFKPGEACQGLTGLVHANGLPAGASQDRDRARRRGRAGVARHSLTGFDFFQHLGRAGGEGVSAGEAARQLVVAVKDPLGDVRGEAARAADPEPRRRCTRPSEGGRQDERPPCRRCREGGSRAPWITRLVYPTGQCPRSGGQMASPPPSFGVGPVTGADLGV